MASQHLSKWWQCHLTQDIFSGLTVFLHRGLHHSQEMFYAFAIPWGHRYLVPKLIYIWPSQIEKSYSFCLQGYWANELEDGLILSSLVSTLASVLDPEQLLFSSTSTPLGFQSIVLGICCFSKQCISLPFVYNPAIVAICKDIGKLQCWKKSKYDMILWSEFVTAF